MVSSKNCPWLNDGVTMLILGQGLPFCMLGGTGLELSVHGQPDLPMPAAGSSLNNSGITHTDIPWERRHHCLPLLGQRETAGRMPALPGDSELKLSQGFPCTRK